MTASYLVIYDIEPEDPGAFVEYYLDTHVPLLREFPGLLDVEVMRGVRPRGLFLVCRMRFADLVALEAAVDGPHRRVTKADMANFPDYSGTVRWEIVEDQPLEP